MAVQKTAREHKLPVSIRTKTMITQTLEELLTDHITLDVEGIYRIYLIAYQPMLQTGGGVSAFFKGHREANVVSTTLMAPMRRAFVTAIEQFAKRGTVEIIHFKKGERKDEIISKGYQKISNGSVSKEIILLILKERIWT